MSLREYKEFLSEILPDRAVHVQNKNRNISTGILYTFLRLQEMFKYENLPDTIPQKYLEFYLMVNGHCAIIKHEGELYACKGGFGGDPDAYYVPTKYIIANPYLKVDKTFTRGVDCVVMGNDSAYYGLYSLVSKYITLMAENELSMNISVINSRIISLITASTDNEYESAKQYLKDVEDGKLGAMLNAPFFDGIRTQPYANTAQANSIISLIEYEQYLKASLFNEIGLNANYNMKRESINSNESQLNDDMLTPLIDNMLRMRQEGIDQINEMFDTDIKVDFASAWKENEITTQIELERGDINDTGENNVPADNTMGDNDIFDDNDNGELPPGEPGEDEKENTEYIKEDLKEIKEDLEEIKEEVLGDEQEKND